MMNTVSEIRSGANGHEDDRNFNRLKAELHERLISSLDLSGVRVVDPEILRRAASTWRRGSLQPAGGTVESG